MKTTLEFHPNGMLVRWCCTKCKRYGIWLTKIADAERNGGLHEREMHPQERAVA